MTTVEFIVLYLIVGVLIAGAWVAIDRPNPEDPDDGDTMELLGILVIAWPLALVVALLMSAHAIATLALRFLGLGIVLLIELIVTAFDLIAIIIRRT